MVGVGSAADMLTGVAGEPITAAEITEGGPVVMASRTGIWICRDDETRSVALALTSRPTQDLGVIRRLLTGCLMAAIPQRDGPAPPDPEVNLEDYVFNLCLTYHTTASTPPTMRVARDRFLAIGEDGAADLAGQKASEEAGHDRLALRDLETLGLPAETLVREAIPALAHALVASFATLARSERPYGAFGYCYVLERMAMMRTRQEIDAIHALAPKGVNITRCRRVHSAIGADTDHVADLVEFVAELPIADRISVCQSIHQTARLISEHRADPAGREALRALLTSWGWQPFVGTTAKAGATQRAPKSG